MEQLPLASAVEPMPIAGLRPHPGNARTHSKRQIRQIADSIRRFGFTNPILIGEEGEILAGHGRVEAAKLLGLESVPTVRLSHLSPAQRKAYVIADNKLALNAGWGREVLATELQGLIDIDFEVELTGFSLAEIDIVLDEARDGSPSGPAEADDEIPSLPDATAVTRKGDVWLLGRHRLICGDSRDRTVFDLLMGNGRADLIFTDPPYNLPIDGHVCGLGRIRHREFAMGVGEMSVEAFTGFLRQTLGHAASLSRDGAIAFVCMDWRHIGGTSKRGPSGLFRAQEPLRLEQDQWRHGLILPQQARAGVRVQGGCGGPHQHLWSRGQWALSNQRVGLCGGKYLASRPQRGTRPAPDRQAGRPGGRCHQGLLAPWRDGARSIWRLRDNPDCG